MGTGNANRGGGLDRAKAAQVTRLNRVQADEIAQHLDAMSVVALDRPETIESARESYAKALTSAADAIRILSKQRALTPDVNEAYAATGYRLDTNDETHEMRISLYQDDQKNVRSFLMMDSTEAYDMAHRILKGYDQIEGIK
jgi:galactokinase